MPELAGRDRIEQAAGGELAGIFAGQRTRVEIHAPNFDQIASGEWQQQEREILFLLILLMGSTFMLGSFRVGAEEGVTLRQPEVELRAERWAQTRARELAGQIVATSRERIKNGWATLGLDYDLDAAFGADRADGIVITETTAANTAGEQDVAAEFERRGAVVTKLWITERDEKVCPICGRLDGEDQYRWAIDFPTGPPAHPRCRCTLKFEVEYETESAVA